MIGEVVLFEKRWVKKFDKVFARRNEYCLEKIICGVKRRGNAIDVCAPGRETTLAEYEKSISLGMSFYCELSRSVELDFKSIF